jgi:hypothetical protein
MYIHTQFLFLSLAVQWGMTEEGWGDGGVGGWGQLIMSNKYSNSTTHFWSEKKWRHLHTVLIIPFLRTYPMVGGIFSKLKVTFVIWKNALRVIFDTHYRPSFSQAGQGNSFRYLSFSPVWTEQARIVSKLFFKHQSLKKKISSSQIKSIDDLWLVLWTTSSYQYDGTTAQKKKKDPYVDLQYDKLLRIWIREPQK